MADPPQSGPDIEEHLEVPEDIEADLRLAIEMGSAPLFARVLSALIHKYGISRLAKKAGVRRKTLYRVANHGNPRLSMLVAILRALGYRLTIRRRDAEQGEFERA